MAVKLRLRRTGAKKKSCFRIVVADSRCPRNGRFIEAVGFYDPRRKLEQVNLERADYWIGNGAQPTPTVVSILARARMEVVPRPAAPIKKERAPDTVLLPPPPPADKAPAEEAPGEQGEDAAAKTPDTEAAKTDAAEEPAASAESTPEQAADEGATPDASPEATDEDAADKPVTEKEKEPDTDSAEDEDSDKSTKD